MLCLGSWEQWQVAWVLPSGICTWGFDVQQFCVDRLIQGKTIENQGFTVSFRLPI
jgi:hypothetical protein